MQRTSDGPRCYFGIFLALAGAARIVGTADLAGDASPMANFVAIVFGALALVSLANEFRKRTPAAEITSPSPACSVTDRPKKNQTRFPV